MEFAPDLEIDVVLEFVGVDDAHDGRGNVGKGEEKCDHNQDHNNTFLLVRHRQ